MTVAAAFQSGSSTVFPLLSAGEGGRECMRKEPHLSSFSSFKGGGDKVTEVSTPELLNHLCVGGGEEEAW